MQYLSAGDVLNIHSVLVTETGGAHGVRDRNALASIAELPAQHVFGKELYPSVFLKAAVYVRNIIFGHPFIDGNKRTAMGCADVFLQLNGYRLKAPKGTVEDFAVTTVTTRRELEQIAKWLELNTEKIEH